MLTSHEMSHRHADNARTSIFSGSRIFKLLVIAIFVCDVVSTSVLVPVLADCNVTAELIQRVISISNATIPLVNICGPPISVPWRIYTEGDNCYARWCDAGFNGFPEIRCVNSTLLPHGSCSPCFAGYVCPGTDSIPCPYGTYCPIGSAAPSICPINTWSPQESKQLSDCVGPCPAGWICDGLTPAYTCPQGTFSNITGLTSLSNCTICPVTAFCPGGSEVRYCPFGEIGHSLYPLFDPRMDLAQTFYTFDGLSRDGNTAVLVYPIINTSTPVGDRLFGAFVFVQHLGLFERQAALLQSSPKSFPVTQMSSSGGLIVLSQAWRDDSGYYNFDIWVRDPIARIWSHTELAVNQNLCGNESMSYGSLHPDTFAVSGDGSMLAVPLSCSQLDHRIIFFQPNSTNSSAPWTMMNPYIPLRNAGLLFSQIRVTDDGTVLSVLSPQVFPTDSPPRMFWYSRTSPNGNWTLQSQPILDAWLGTFTSITMNPHMSSDGQTLIFLRSPDDTTYGTFVFVRSSTNAMWTGPVFTTDSSIDVSISSNGQYFVVLTETVGMIYNRTENGTWWTPIVTTYPTDDSGTPLPSQQFRGISLSDDSETILFISASANIGSSLIVPSVVGSPSRCIHCPSGNVCAPGQPIVECPLGYWCGPAAQSANRCPSGTWTFTTGTTSLDQCSSNACLAGSYCDGLSDMTQCPRGRYSASTGTSSCTSCLPGTASNILGSSNPSDCITCQEPNYSSLSQSTSCSTCTTGEVWIASDTTCTQCSPPDGCDGSSQCRIGYTGIECVDCVSGYYHPTDLISSCAECGSTAPWVIPIVIIVLLFTAGFVVKLNSSPIVRLIIIPLNIGLPYMQILSFIRDVDLSWPKSTRSGFALFSLSAFNLRAITESSCIISFQTQFAVSLAFPFIIAIPLIGVYIGWKYIISHQSTTNHPHTDDILPSSSDGGSIAESSPSHPVIASSSSILFRLYGAFGISSRSTLHQRLIQTIISLLSFAYMFLATTSVSILDCIPIGVDHRVREFVGLECGSKEWKHEYLPFSILGCILYLTGIPILLFYMIRSTTLRPYLSNQWSQYKSTHYSFIPLQLLWELGQALVIRFGGKPTIQVILCSMLFVLRAVCVIWLNPYTSIWHVREEVILSGLSILILISGSIFYASGSGHTGSIHSFFLVIVWICIITMILIVLAAMILAFKQTKGQSKSNSIDTTTASDSAPSSGHLSVINKISPTDTAVEMVELELPTELSDKIQTESRDQDDQHHRPNNSSAIVPQEQLDPATHSIATSDMPIVDSSPFKPPLSIM